MARESLPVSDFTQIPATSIIALVPKNDSTSPVKYHRTMRSTLP